MLVLGKRLLRVLEEVFDDKIDLMSLNLFQSDRTLGGVDEYTRWCCISDLPKCESALLAVCSCGTCSHSFGVCCT